MPSCGAPNCKNRSSSESSKTFHLLPSESRKEVRSLWLSKIKRKFVPKHMYICSDHFEQDCFERDLRTELLEGRSRLKLKPDSIPTIFDHAKPSKRRLSSINREKNRIKKALVEEALVEQSSNPQEEDQYLPSDTLTSSRMLCEPGSQSSLGDVSRVSIDKAIDNVPRVKDAKTQYSISHYYHSVTKKSSKAVKQLTVKITPKKIVHEVSTNTDISFTPEDNVHWIMTPVLKCKVLKMRK